MIDSIYKSSLALLTDLYQLTMSYGYWKSGMQDHEAVFHLYYRNNPFQGGYVIACGLETAIEYLKNLRFDGSDIEYLATLTGNDGAALFDSGFLEYLRRMEFSCDIDAAPEGTVMFPFEPLVRVTGPIIQCQIVETALLNIINFQTLIATKAARVVTAAMGDPVLEFGLRRAQGIDGGISASRAAFIGGCDSTSNVVAGKIYGIPVKGTHAHSWIMCFDSELEAFDAYAGALPNNCIFLVDTYDTLQGVRHAVEAGKRLRDMGHEMVGIRLDSGDLAYLSIEARKILDEGGFPNAVIVASNDLDEEIITSLKVQGARIAVWGVGTKLVSAYDQPALGGVFKLSAIRSPGSAWRYAVKLSEQVIKITTPGLLQVRRFESGGEFKADAIYDTNTPHDEVMTIVDPMDQTRRKKMSPDMSHTDLLVPVFRGGAQVRECPDIHAVKVLAAAQLNHFYSGVKRFINPHQYPVGLEKRLCDLKTELVLRARGYDRHE